MIFWISLIILIIFWIAIPKLINKDKTIAEVLAMIGFIYVIGWGIIHVSIGMLNLGTLSPWGRTELATRYEQLQKNKDNDYAVDDIMKWNESITINKKYQRDFWIGPYVPNVYDDFDCIE